MAQRNTYKEDEEQVQNLDWHDLRRIAAYIKPYLGEVIRVVMVVLVITFVLVADPAIIREVIDVVIPHKDLHLLAIYATVFFLLIIIGELCLRYRTIHIMHIGQMMLKDMRRDIFTHVQSLSFSYFDSRPHGKILVRIATTSTHSPTHSPPAL